MAGMACSTAFLDQQRPSHLDPTLRGSIYRPYFARFVTTDTTTSFIEYEHVHACTPSCRCAVQTPFKEPTSNARLSKLYTIYLTSNINALNTTLTLGDIPIRP
jgi:hypothetical protein